MITYGHEKFVKQAIESILDQKTTFEYELLIANDCSPDNTDQIIKGIIATHPFAYRIKYYIHAENIGMQKNVHFVFSKVNGEFIASCEGDDYWSNPLKLQKQIDFLEANPDYVVCAHRVEMLNGDKLSLDNFNSEKEESYTLQELAEKGNLFHTPSIVYRNIIKEFPNWYTLSPAGDYPLYMLLAKHGKIKYFPEPMAVYRVGVGIWSKENLNDLLIRWKTVLDYLKIEFKEDASILSLLKKQEDEKKLILMNNINNNIYKNTDLLANNLTLKNIIQILGLKCKNILLRLFYHK
jgi:glycosyltransferase involved in cell wall biosynthesis